MQAAFPLSNYYEASAPPVSIGRQRTCPHPDLEGRNQGRPQRFPCSPYADRQVRRPAAIPTASPRLRRRPSPGPPRLEPSTSRKVDRPQHRRSCAALPLSTRFEPVHRLQDVIAGSSRTPSRLASRTRPVWQCQAVPSLSGLLHPPRRPPDQAALSFGRVAATTRRGRSLTSPRTYGASWRTMASTNITGYAA